MNGKACLLPTLLVAAQVVTAATPPNIVLILTDDQGYADVGCFGAKGFVTPNLDRLAKEGRQFTNFHVAQAVCSASRAALLTGCYPNRVGIGGALNPMADFGISGSEMTLAELVKQRGYATGMVGKWHLGHLPPFLPTRHGFDEYFGLPYSNDMWPENPRNKKFPALPLFDGEKVIIPAVTHADQEQLTTWYTERAVKFIDGNRDKPFFLYVAHSMPHVPLHVSDKFKGKSAQGLYGDVIEEIDWSVGRIMDAIERNGLQDNTWVIFTSDNGPWLIFGNHAGSAYPLREGKGTAWEGGTRVPCLMRWPGKIPAGTVCNDMLMTIDLLPTIAAVIGAKLPAHAIDGLDEWPIISGQQRAANPHSSYWFYYNKDQLHAVATGDGRWKMQFPHSYGSLAGKPAGKDGVPAGGTNCTIEKIELYDLVNDVGETDDVAEKYPEIVKRLEAEAEGAREELGDALMQRAGKGVREPGGGAARSNLKKKTGVSGEGGPAIAD